MSQYTKTTNVKVAAGNSVAMNLSRNHFTTLGFGSLVPVYNLECVPGDRISVTPDLFARVAPMALPPFANVDVKLTAFFVPFRNVWMHWNNFLAGTPVPNTDGSAMVELSSVPTVSAYTLVTLFTGYSNDASQEPKSDFAYVVEGARSHSVQYYQEIFEGTREAPADSIDFILENPQNAGMYNGYHLTVRGKRVLHILHALGYNFNFLKGNAGDNTDYRNEYYSALPLLCFFKAFVDWHVPSQIQPSHPLWLLLQKVRNLASASGGTPTASMALSVDDLTAMFASVVDYYDNDYFTSAWLNSNSPASGLNHYNETANDNPKAITTNNVSQLVKSDSLRDSNPEVAADDWNTRAFTSNSLSYDGLTLLQRFANFVRRNNFAGSRAVERILARFGVRVPDAVVDYSDYIGSWSTPLRVSDVTAQGSNVETLGEYAGKGFLNGQGAPTWNYEVSQHGMFIIFAGIDPNTTFVDGVRRELYHLSPLDYYTPEFDGTLMQGIAGSELYGKLMYGVPNFDRALTFAGVRYNDIFGFIQRYAEYKRSLDDVSGDFDIPSLRTSLDGFLFTRRLFDVKAGVLERYDTQSLDTVDENGLGGISMDSTPSASQFPEVTPISVLPSSDAVQYNRIFKDTTGYADPFFCQFRFNVTAHRRMLAANDSAELFGRGRSNEMNTNGLRV